MGASLAGRVLARLEQAELSQVNPHFQADYRIAWITVLRASRGEPTPHLSATYAVLGIHPDKVWPAVIARRKALLGNEYSLLYDDAGNLRPQDWSALEPPSSPKKPVQSVRLGWVRARPAA